MLGLSTVPAVTFHDWVREVAGDDSYETIGAKVGTTGNTVRSWKHTAPAARFVIAFAREYGRPIPEAFMQAYGLTAEELGVEVVDDPRRLTNDQLVEELRRRLTDAEGPAYSDRLTRQREQERQQARKK